MRSRVALSILIALATLSVVVPILAAGSAATKEATASWKSLAVLQTPPPPPSDRVVLAQLHYQQVVFLDDLHAQQVAALGALAAASRAQARAAAIRAARAPASTTTPAPVISSASSCGAEDHIAPGPAAAAEAAGVPCAWVPTAVCEESGRDDANYGFFGIQEWLGFDGYPRAGAAPLGVQLAWEAAHGQGPPDAPGQCHGY